MEVEKLVYVPIDKELLTISDNVEIKTNARYIDLINYLIDTLAIVKECRINLDSIRKLNEKHDY